MPSWEDLHIWYKNIPVGDPALICHWKIKAGTSSGIPGLIWKVTERSSNYFPESFQIDGVLLLSKPIGLKFAKLVVFYGKQEGGIWNLHSESVPVYLELAC